MPFGVALVFLLPPSQGRDEPNHFFRTFSISEGHLEAQAHGDRRGDWIPTCVVDYFERLLQDAAKPSRMRPATFWRTSDGCPDGRTEFVPFENTALYSPVAYLPQVIGIRAGRLLRLPLPLLFYLGRLAGLGAYIALVWMALRLLPREGHVLFVLALLPTSLVFASSYSADGMAIALAILSVSLVIRARERGSDSWRCFAALVSVLGALGLTKHVYLVFAPLIVLVPVPTKGGRYRAVALKLAAGLLIISLGLLWMATVRTIAPTAAGAAINPGKQMAFAVGHPVSFTMILVRTLTRRDIQNVLLPGIFSDMGNFRHFGDPLPPLAVVLFASALLAFSFAEDGRRPMVRSLRELGAAVLPPILAIGGLGATELALWLRWTPIGSDVVSGMQGRYFLPLLPLLVLTWTEVARSRPLRTWSKGVVLASTALLVWCGAYSVHLFY